MQKAPLPQIHVRNLQRKFHLDIAGLQKFAERALRLCLQIKGPAGRSGDQPPEFFVLLVSEARMSALHGEFLKESGPTDVITFQHGEIFVSVPTARRHALRFGTSILREIQLYIVHGLLHLRGFDDCDPKDARKMQLTQAKILRAARK